MEPSIDLTWAAHLTDRDQTGGVIIRANPDFATQITNRMKPYKAIPYKAKPALEEVASYVRMEMIPRTFKQEGPGWRKLARRTINERRALGYGGEHPILQRSGDLFREVTDRSHPNHVEIIKTGKYARIEVGGRSEKFIRNQSGNRVYHIPSRPMIPGTGKLPLPERDRRNIRAILQKGIERTLNGQ